MEWIHPMHLRIGNMDIHLITEIVAPYVAALKGVKSLAELRGVTANHEVFAGDAYDLAHTMTEEDWPAYERFNVIGRDNRYHGDELKALSDRFGAILMPEQMLHVGAVAGHFGAPDGLAVIRLTQQGMLEEVSGRAVITLPSGRVKE